MLFTYIILGAILIISSVGAGVIGIYWFYQSFLEMNKRRHQRKLLRVVAMATLGAILWMSASFGLSIIFGDLTMRLISQ